MAKAPAPRRLEGESSNRVTLKVNGVVYPVRFDEVTALDASALRQATGTSLKSLLGANLTDPDIDVIAALVWLSRRQNGAPNLPFAAVAKEITYNLEVEEVAEDAAEEDEHDPQH